ncbi:MAG: hypothetical protein M3162_00065 [Thermoproteota archaeon]|nr:hypothetical protein [Thermoproteota archaeon]
MEIDNNGVGAIRGLASLVGCRYCKAFVPGELSKSMQPCFTMGVQVFNPLPSEYYPIRL